MSTCGYICPKCEGVGYDENANPCNWCTANTEEEPTHEAWIKSTHEGCGCAGE